MRGEYAGRVPGGNGGGLFYDFESDTIGQYPVGWEYIYSNVAPTGKVVSWDGTQAVQVGSGSSGRMFLGTTEVPTSTDMTVQMRLWNTNLASFGYIWLRSNAVTNDGAETYGMGVRFDSGGLELVRSYNSAEASLSVVSAPVMTVGAWVNIKVQVEGTAVRVKRWADGAEEPASWELEGTYASVASGRVSVYSYKPIYFDDVTIDYTPVEG